VLIVRTVAVAAMLATLSSSAEPEWIKVTSENFELYTTAGEKRGRNALRHFESIRQFFLDVAGVKEISELPVRIIGFRSPKQFEPYKINEFATAFYTQSRARDYIVMSNISSSHYDTAVHEYTHLIQRHTGRKYPIWMNEGLAQLYETLTPVGKKVRIGDVQPGRFQLLRTKNWLDLQTIFNVEYGSKHYSNKRHAGMFYAQSWALTHMLNLHAAYRESSSYGKLVSAVASGEPTASAIQRLYGNTVDQVYTDLRTYIREARLFTAVYDLKLNKTAEDPLVQSADGLESGLVLADLLSVMHDREEEARGRYLDLSEQHPDNAEIFEGLGYLALRAHDDDKTRQYLGRAVELGSTSPRVYRDYAYFLQQADEPPSARIPLLEKALLLQPGDADTHLRVALLYLREKSHIRALRHLGLVRKVDEEKAFRLFDSMTYAYYELGKWEEARKAAERARPYAKSPDEKLRVERMLEAIDYRSNPQPDSVVNVASAPIPAPSDGDLDEDNDEGGTPRLVRRSPAGALTSEERAALWEEKLGEDWLRLEGQFQTLECIGSTANMHLRSGDKTFVLAILNPGDIIVRGQKVTLDFQCGPQGDEPIAVEYEKSEEAGAGVEGVVRAITF
jgi:tetratricopeptide (TPR) repeat protein